MSEGLKNETRNDTLRENEYWKPHQYNGYNNPYDNFERIRTMWPKDHIKSKFLNPVLK